LKLNPINGAEF